MRDGDLISKALSDDFEVKLKMFFPFLPKSTKMHSKIILQSDDHSSYEFISNFEELTNDFKENLDLNIHYKIYENVSFDNQGKIDSTQHDSGVNSAIINNNSYFVLNNDRNKDYDLLLQTFKQMCLFKYDKRKYFDFMREVKGACFILSFDRFIFQKVPIFHDCLQQVYEVIVRSVDPILDKVKILNIRESLNVLKKLLQKFKIF